MGKNILQTTNKRVRPSWLCPLIKKIFTLLILLLLLPVTALAVETNTVYVGGVALAGSSTSIVYATTNESGEVITEGATADNYNIKWDGSTLTLHDATIQKELYASDLPLSNIAGAAIGVINQNGNAELTIQLEGSNTIEETNQGLSMGIYVYSSGGGAALNIKGNGTLVLNSNYQTIQVISSNGNAALSIENAKVTATSSYGFGVTVRSGSSETSSASLTVDGGSLTATAQSSGVSGIRLLFGTGGTSDGTPTVTVSNNAIVRANGSAGGITSNSSTGIQYETGSDSTGGIVFDGKNGTVYGNVTLQEDLEIGEGESLTIGDGASLDTNGKTITVESGGKLEGTPIGNGTVKIAPTITTTESLPDGEVGTVYSQTLTATGDPTITWNVTSGTLPAGLTLDTNTGTISGTPTTANTYNFTVTATNDSGNDSKQFSLTIDPKQTVSVTGVTLDQAELSLYTGESKTLIATVQPSDATIQNVTWSSDKPEVATVEDGKVTAVAEGEATITVTTEDGTFTATCKVTVTHSMVHTPKKDATCTADGNEEYWTCEICGKYFSDEAGTTEISLAETVIPATGHHYVNGTCTVCGEKDPDYRPDPISYYNIYVEDVCDGVEVTTSKNVVREGGSISVYVEKDTANYTFDNFKVYYKRSYYGTWDELKEGTQPGEYPIKNIWTHIYIKAEGAKEKEDPTGIESIEGVKVYTKDGSLYVQTPQREQVIIVSMSGAVVKNEEQVGLKQYHGLQPGIYIVRVGQTTYKLRLN